MLPLILAGFPHPIFWGALGNGAASLALFSVASESDSHTVLLGATMTAIASSISVIAGTLVSIARIKADELRLQVEAEQRDHDRKHAAEQAELERKERMHNFKNDLNLLNLRLEEKKQRIELLEKEVTNIRAENAFLVSSSARQDKTANEQGDLIESNRASIEQVRKIQEESGTFRPVTKAN